LKPQYDYIVATVIGLDSLVRFWADYASALLNHVRMMIRHVICKDQIGLNKNVEH
jgi:hypothetical protein